MHAPRQCFQRTLAYFATAVSYARKMFMKLTPCVGPEASTQPRPRSEGGRQEFRQDLKW